MWSSRSEADFRSSTCTKHNSNPEIDPSRIRREPRILEGRVGFCKLGHKFLTVLKDKIICKNYNALFSKITISIKNKQF